MPNTLNTPPKLPYGTQTLILMLLPSGPHMVQKDFVAQDLNFNIFKVKFIKADQPAYAILSPAYSRFRATRNY